MDRKEMATAIMEARKEAKLTQEEAAKRLNISRPAYRKWESGEENPGLDTLNKLAELFGCRYVGKFEKLSDTN